MMLSVLLGTIFALIFYAGTVNGSCSTSTAERLRVHEVFKPVKTWPEFTCETESIDAATRTGDDKVYLFKGDYYWRLIGSVVAPGYPRPISIDWDGLPGNLNAAVTTKGGRTFFFKNSTYWSFQNKKMDPGYPRPMSVGFCGIPENIDAATSNSKNDYLFFFKGKEVYRFEGGESQTPVSRGYPLSIETSMNMNSPVEAVMEGPDGDLIFFHGKHVHSKSFGEPIEVHGNFGLDCNHLRRRIPLPIRN